MNYNEPSDLEGIRQNRPDNLVGCVHKPCQECEIWVAAMIAAAAVLSAPEEVIMRGLAEVPAILSMGMILGVRALLEKWISPLNDTLSTRVAGYHKVKISDMVEETYELHKSNLMSG